MAALIGLKCVCSSGMPWRGIAFPNRGASRTFSGQLTIARIENITDNINLVQDALFVSVGLAPSALALTANVVGRTHAR